MKQITITGEKLISETEDSQVWAVTDSDGMTSKVALSLINEWWEVSINGTKTGRRARAPHVALILANNFICRMD